MNNDWTITGRRARRTWWSALAVVAALLIAGVAHAALAVPGAGAAPQDHRLTLSAQWSLADAHPGDQRALAIVIDLAKSFHINPDPAHTAEHYIPTTLTVASADPRLVVGQPQYPPPDQVMVRYTGKPAPQPAWQGKRVIYLPVVVKADALPATLPGAGDAALTLTLTLHYQMCNATMCFAPASRAVQATLHIVSRTTPITPAIDHPLFAGFDASAFAALGQHPNVSVQRSPSIAKSPDRQTAQYNVLGWQFALNLASPLGLAGLLALAFLAGVVLNLTPCVLPVVPLKVMSLQRQAGSDHRGKTLLLGLIFSAGIVATFLVLGMLVAGLVVGLHKMVWGQIFSYTWTSIVLAVVLVLMAVGSLGLYSIRLPRWVYTVSPSHDTLTGNFLLGVLTAVLSTPCTAPLLGGTVTAAVALPAWLALVLFAVMGAGMAGPYLLLTANPRWIDRLPHTGPGSELLKQIMGLLLLAVAAFFLTPVLGATVADGLIVAMLIVAAAWLAIGTFRITGRRSWRLAALAPLGLVALVGWTLVRTLTVPPPIAWQPFTAAAFDTARQQGKTVLVEFTADWCGNCKALELTTYRNAKLASLLHDDDYAAFRVDLTRQSNVEGWQWQQKLGGGGGIPLAAVYDHQNDRPRVFQGIFTANELLAALQPGGETRRAAR